jgi:hypothetical protein
VVSLLFVPFCAVEWYREIKGLRVLKELVVEFERFAGLLPRGYTRVEVLGVRACDDDVGNGVCTGICSVVVEKGVNADAEAAFSRGISAVEEEEIGVCEFNKFTCNEVNNNKYIFMFV